SDLGSKLTAARSIPDMMTAWQFWAARRAEMMADDRTHLLTNYQMFADTLAQAASNAWRPADAIKQTGSLEPISASAADRIFGSASSSGRQIGMPHSCVR